MFASEESQRLARDLLKEAEELVEMGRDLAATAEGRRQAYEFIQVRAAWIAKYRRWEIMELIR